MVIERKPFKPGTRLYVTTGFRRGEPGIVIYLARHTYGHEGYVMTFMDGSQDLYYYSELSDKKPDYPRGKP